MCLAAGFAKTAVRQDYAGIDRMVFAIKAKQNVEKEDEKRYADLLLEITREL